ncbi:uncharacterized protein [Macrobrachium rosenbergii]|uniref:uncharacterized protein n=1 Tax=Macrobrachium rosenbergii TaxID=79674 RepID=UPI0034D55E65
MLSDNATTFVAALEYLKTMSENPRVMEYLLDIKCNWKFVPARAPWFGAIWERLIGLLKSCLKKIVGQALLRFEELTCVLVELEGIINDRPLSYLPGDLNQLEILIPNHLILGRKLKPFPREVVNWEEISGVPTYGRREFTEKRFLYGSKLCNDLWKRWEREYLTMLRETHQVGIVHGSWPRIEEGVLIHDEGPRSKWKLSQVIKLHKGRDKVPRVATLRTAHSQLMRSVIKLYPLELWQDIRETNPATDGIQSSTRPSRRTAQIAAEARKALIRTGLL